MTNQIVKQEARILDSSTWQTIQAVAPVMKASRLFGVATEAQAAAIMCKGYELGLTLTASFEFIAVIQDKPALNPRGALALILNSPHLQKLDVQDFADDKGNPTHCTVTMTRANGFSYTVTYSINDAKRAGLVKQGSGWEKYPANMLRWRAIGFCADVVFPDVIGGLKRSDEYGADLTPEGDAVEGTYIVIDEPDDKLDFNQMLDRMLGEYDPDDIVAANDGKVPSTVEELQEITVKLQKGGEDAEDVG